MSISWEKPKVVSPDSDVFSLVPKMSDIPQEFTSCSNEWNKLASTWFFTGLTQVTVKPGIDETKALKHLRFVLTSWDLKHEHKIASAAFLMSMWVLKGESQCTKK